MIDDQPMPLMVVSAVVALGLLAAVSAALMWIMRRLQ